MTSQLRHVQQAITNHYKDIDPTFSGTFLTYDRFLRSLPMLDDFYISDMCVHAMTKTGVSKEYTDLSLELSVQKFDAKNMSGLMAEPRKDIKHFQIQVDLNAQQSMIKTHALIVLSFRNADNKLLYNVQLKFPLLQITRELHFKLEDVEALKGLASIGKQTSPIAKLLHLVEKIFSQKSLEGEDLVQKKRQIYLIEDQQQLQVDHLNVNLRRKKTDRPVLSEDDWEMHASPAKVPRSPRDLKIAPEENDLEKDLPLIQDEGQISFSLSDIRLPFFKNTIREFERGKPLVFEEESRPGTMKERELRSDKFWRKQEEENSEDETPPSMKDRYFAEESRPGTLRDLPESEGSKAKLLVDLSELPNLSKQNDKQDLLERKAIDSTAVNNESTIQSKALEAGELAIDLAPVIYRREVIYCNPRPVLITAYAVCCLIIPLLVVLAIYIPQKAK